MEFDPAIEQQTTETSAISSPNNLPLFHESSATAATEQLERTLNINLDKQNIESAHREPFLLRHLAQTRLELHFERVYSNIFGSQIYALKKLNEVPLIIEQLDAIFQVVKNNNPETFENFGFDRWLHFLLANEVAERQGNIVRISEVGREFLLYLVMRHLSEDRPF